MRAATTMALALSALTSVVSAQKEYTASDLNDVENINANTRSSWCQGQRNSCRALCDPADTNDCDVGTLEFDCKCNNGSSPGLQYYDATMPTYICLRVYEECIAAAPDDADAQDKCTEAREANCDPTKLQSVPAPGSNNDDDDDDDDSNDDSSESESASESGGASSTGDADSAESTDDSSSDEEDDSFAAPKAAPAAGAAALAFAMMAYLI